MKESLLAEDFKATINSHNGLGQYVNLYKITSRSEYDIRDYWKLNSRVDFFEKYHDQIKNLSKFKFGRITFVSEDGKFREAARNSEQDFWKVTENDKEKRSVEFDYVGAFDFLEANRFHKIHTIDLRNGEYKYVKIDDFVMYEVSDTEIREFVMQYVKMSTKDRDVLNMFLSRLGSLLDQTSSNGLRMSMTRPRFPSRCHRHSITKDAASMSPPKAWPQVRCRRTSGKRQS